MFEYLYEWMKNIAFYMVLITAVIHILPNSDYKKYIRFFTGMVLVVMLATPLLKIFGMEHPLGSLYDSKEYQEQMKKIKREEEMYKLQKTHTATLTSLENSYDTVEANKKYLLATIEKNGMNIEKIVKSVNFDVKNMQSVITSLFNQTISAIKSIKVSSNSYSDNRNISIRGDSRDILNALQNRVGLAVSYGNYN